MQRRRGGGGQPFNRGRIKSVAHPTAQVQPPSHYSYQASETCISGAKSLERRSPRGKSLHGVPW